MSTTHSQSPTPEEGPALHGLLAEYATPAELVKASRKIRDAGYTRWDTFTPFPVHGIDQAMGIKMTRLPWIVFVVGTLGCLAGLGLQWYTNAFDYQYLTSGKPIFSLPANIPVIFELTVLFSAFATIGSMLVMNGLPLLAHPLDLKERFGRVTDDRFFLLVEAGDPRFDETTTRQLLEGTGPASLETVPEDRVTQAQPPKFLAYVAIILGVAALIPFPLIAAARETKGREPRIHVVPDMDFQPKFKAETTSSLFADGRADRLPPEGTIAQGELRADDHLYRGLDQGDWARTFPAKLDASVATMERGKQKFEIYCAPCHGRDGKGDGMINQRAEKLAQGNWVPPSNLHQDYLRKMPVGQLFNTATNGIRNMTGYASQTTTEERWAIVMYLRALQRGSESPASDLNQEERSKLR